MPNWNGPVSSLPGYKAKTEAGAMCDDHPERSSVATIQGETDSMGCEFIEMCSECYEKYKGHKEEAREIFSICDWCNGNQKGCSPTRDYEEGTSGPVYNVCPGCRQRKSEEAQAELDEDY